MSIFEINAKSPERVWKMMKHLNVLILLYIAVISYHAIMGMARSNSAGLFLRTIPRLPMESVRFMAVVFILYGTLLMLFSSEMEEDFMNYIKAAMELVISLMLTAVCGMAYSGIIILVMTDVIHSGYTRQKKIQTLIPIILCYFIVDSDILNLWFRNVSFSDYLVFYNAEAAGILQSILNTMELINIVMFIIFLIVTLRYQMDETARIMRLNEELTEANIQLEEYSRKSAEMAQTQERNRLAREIHDTIGHVLTGIVTGLEACLLLLDTRPDLARTQIEVIQETARQGMKDVRSSVRALRPDALLRLAFNEAIEQMIDDMCRSTGIHFEYICEDSLSNLAADEEDVIYRILQESITNSVRHGHPTRINIRIERHDNRISIRIKDNGVGCEELHRGFGLTHMQERLDMLGGSMTVDGSDGFTVNAIIPLRLYTGGSLEDDKYSDS
jgi:signal transduction histidine kinase